MYDLYDVCVFFLLVLLVMHWWRISEQKQYALSSAKKHCEQRDVQLLDQTLVFLKHRFIKDSNGRKRFCRVYEFDFSTDGEERFKGEIVLSGYATLRIILAAELVEITNF